MKRSPYSLGFIFLFIVYSINAQHDTLKLKNNDKLIGEVKRMAKGVLVMETDYSDADFKVTWLEVVRISSSQQFFVTLSNGKRFMGQIKSENTASGYVLLVNETEKINARIEDVTEFKAVQTDFLSQLSTSISFGYNFTKSNKLSQLVWNGRLGYAAFKWEVNANFNTVTSNQDDAERTQRTDGGLGFRYFLDNDWFLDATYSFLSNNQLNLDLRSNIRAGAGKYIVHNNQQYLGTGVGLAWNNENYITDEAEDKNSLEAYVGIEYNMFDVGDLDIYTRAIVYPSLTESGRIRSDVDVDIKYDLPLDLFAKLGFTYNFDNQPPEGFNKDDYILNTTIGWEFN